MAVSGQELQYTMGWHTGHLGAYPVMLLEGIENAAMGIIHTAVRLSNPVEPKLHPLECFALADTGALHLCIPEHIAIQLNLTALEQREVTLADGSKRLISYVGPIKVEFANRQCFVGAMVMGDEVLLGAIPMEDMDLVIRPATREVTVNPASPNVPGSLAKGLYRG
jgi:clan AA aspartic protease